jgi:hypothetical protein
MKTVLDIEKYHRLFEQSSTPVKRTCIACLYAVQGQFEADGITPVRGDAAEELIAAITAYHVACNHKFRR